MQDAAPIVTAADLQTVWTFIAEHKWVALLALLVGGLVRLLKSDVPGPVVVPRLRAPLALAFGMLSSGLERVATGVPWVQAFGDGLGAGIFAILLHVLIVESAMGGKEPFRKTLNAILGPIAAFLESMKDPPPPPPPPPSDTQRSAVFSNDPDETKRDLPPLLKRMKLRFLVLFAVVAMSSLTGCEWLRPAACVIAPISKKLCLELPDGSCEEVNPEDRAAIGRHLMAMKAARAAASQSYDAGVK